MHSIHLTTQPAKGGTSSQYTDLAAANNFNIICIRTIFIILCTYFCCIHCVYHIYNYSSSPDPSSPKDKQANKTVCGLYVHNIDSFKCMVGV